MAELKKQKVKEKMAKSVNYTGLFICLLIGMLIFITAFAGMLISGPIKMGTLFFLDIPILLLIAFVIYLIIKIIKIAIKTH